MSLQHYFTTYMRLTKQTQADGMGGAVVRWQSGAHFSGEVADSKQSEVASGGTTAIRERPMLLHAPTIRLLPGDVVQRVGDGARYLVLGDSADRTSPPLAGLALCRVPVERVVTAP